MARPQPRVFNPEELKRFQEAAQKQTEKMRNPLTTDEEAYPMFEIPNNGKKLIYVPNLTHLEYDETIDAEVPVLNWDKGAYHTTRQRGSFVTYRCTSGIDGIEGFDGTCPFCETNSENWDLYNILYAEAARKKGIDIDSPDAVEGLKNERSELVKAMAVGGKFISLTFPIVVVDCKEGTLNPLTDGNGDIIGTINWYSIRESTYNEKWKTVLDTFPEGEQCAAGHWFVLDYTFEDKSGKNTKMRSAAKLKVISKTMTGKDTEKNNWYAQQEARFDEYASGWTPELAMATIYNNQVYDVPTLQPIVDEIMRPTREKLLIYNSGASAQNAIPENTGANTSGDANSPENIAASFGGTQQSQGVQEEQ